MKYFILLLGHGALYRYDAVGSYERVRAVCVGKGEKLIQPLLDEMTNMEQVSTDFSYVQVSISLHLHSIWLNFYISII